MPWTHKIPADIFRPCDRPGCGGTYMAGDRLPHDGEPHFDADGSAMLSLVCDRHCGMESCGYWQWKWYA